MRIPEIIIVDDHATFRTGLASILAAEKLGNVIGEASDGAEFPGLLECLHPDLVFMDIDMPGMGGVEATMRAFEKAIAEVLNGRIYESGDSTAKAGCSCKRKINLN